MELLEDIMNNIPDSLVVAKKATKKKVTGRPRSAKRVAVEEANRQKEFVENYDMKADYRPEPKRLILALSLPEAEQQRAIEDALLPRQLAFCKEYVVDFVQTQAAIRAGYSPHTACQVARNLLQYRAVNKLIEFYTRSNAQKITTVDPEWVIQKVTEIVTTAAKDGDRLRGLELLARHLGMFIERTEISGRDGEAIRIEETNNQASEVARRLREMGKKAALSVVK